MNQDETKNHNAAVDQAKAMDDFRKGLATLIDTTMAAGIAAPNIVLVLEMSKINLAMQYIQNAQAALMHAQAQQMAEQATQKSPIILPPGVKS